MLIDVVDGINFLIDKKLPVLCSPTDLYKHVQTLLHPVNILA
jgi:hypothetical protein